MKIDIGMLIKAARRLRQQMDNAGPLLGFTFPTPGEHPSCAFDYCESEGLVALEAFADVLSEVCNESASEEGDV